MVHESSHSKKLRVIVIDPDHDELVVCTTSIAATGMAEIVAETTSLSMAGSMIDRHDPDFVFLSLHQNHRELNQTVARIRKSNTRCRIVVLGEHPDPDEILLCFRAGAEEFLVKPLETAELEAVFQRLEVRQEMPNLEEKETGAVWAFWGSRGGCGVTTTAYNMARCVLQEHRTVLVDFHFGQGDMAVHVDVRPKLSLADLSESSERLDGTLVDSITVKHKSGLHLILQSFDTNSSYLEVEEMLNLIRILRSQYEYVLLDIGTDASLAAILAPQIDRFLLLMQQDLPSLTLAQRKLDMLNHVDIEPESVTLILNAFHKRNSIGLRQAGKVVGRSDFQCIRKDDDAVASAINQGITVREVSGWSKAGKDIKKLAEGLLQHKVEDIKPVQEPSETAETIETLQSLPRLVNPIHQIS